MGEQFAHSANYANAFQTLREEVNKLNTESQILSCIKQFYVLGADFEQPDYSEFAYEIERMSKAEKLKVLEDLCSDILKIDYSCSLSRGNKPNLANLFYVYLLEINKHIIIESTDMRE
jgi:dihydroxyacetone kinase DhaKLM complex PTS-EIIA-like component DhaM